MKEVPPPIGNAPISIPTSSEGAQVISCIVQQLLFDLIIEYDGIKRAAKPRGTSLPAFVGKISDIYNGLVFIFLQMQLARLKKKFLQNLWITTKA